MPKIDAFLKILYDVGASDLHIGNEAAPMVRINGVLEKTKYKELSEEEVRILLYELLTDNQIETFEEIGELDFAYTLSGAGRFRVNLFKKYPGLAAAFRLIPSKIPSLESLGFPFPDVLKRMLVKRNGLILVTGPTNSGKSTTLAAMVDFINENMNHHILTLEDPLEFIHPNKNSLIHQRQIGEHSLSFSNALRAALREDPNVILVGEMRDNETIALALTAAEVGQLVLGTLHTKSAGQTISRLVDAFPVDQQPQIRLTLSETLQGVVAQQLLRRADGKGRVMALEIMIRNSAITSLIREAKSHQINNAILTGKKEGMLLLDQHLKELITKKLISVREAARYAENSEEIIEFGKSLAVAKKVEVA